jgi:hypothetical protein
MASQGPNFPDSAVEDTSFGTQGWDNEANALADDGAFADSSPNATVISTYLVLTDFDFSIPAGATIDGIVVEIKKRQEFGGDQMDERIRIVKGGVIGATDKAQTATSWPTVFTYVSHGGSSDLWGETWTVADINATTFGVAISIQNNGSFNGAAEVDAVRITVHYTTSGMADSTPEITIGNATESIRTATTDPYTFTHTPTGTPKGIVLCAVHGVSATDHISGVTYGGVAMSRVVRATDTVTEPGAAEIWFLGAGIPTGAQTVSIDLTSATTDDFQFVCITLLTNDGGDTEVVDSDGVSENVANPSVTLQYNGRVAAAVGVLYGGGADGSVFTPNANCSTIEDHDLGNFYAEVIKQTTPGNADFTIGGTSGTDDVAFVAAAFANAHRSRPAATNFQDPG